jgi:hypothetical protein
MKETIEIDGYKVVVAKDDAALNPFEEFDCEPPTMVFCEGLTNYGDVPDVSTIVGMMPAVRFSRGNRVRLIKELDCSLKEFAEYRMRYKTSVEETFAELCLQQAPPPDRSWKDAIAHFDMLEWLCHLAEIPFYFGQSNGYCQGHSALVMSFATPEWAKKVGAPKESLEAQCEGAFDLYTAWAWGDVYGISSIIAPDMTEVEDASVWGFYGSDHEKSGLLDSARESIERHKKQEAEENAEAFSAACRDIETIV